MTRYTTYHKKFNHSTIQQEKRIAQAEAEAIEESKNQDIHAQQMSQPLRSKPVCLRCRKRSHTVKFCPLNNANNQNAVSRPSRRNRVFCYNCSSTDHTLKYCGQPRAQDGSLPYAECFICNKTGHLSAQCSLNPNGIYPKGGGCRFCGSNQHLARDCRPTKQAEGGSFVAMSVDPRRENPEDDLLHDSLGNIQKEREQRRELKAKASAQKKAKVVKF